MPFVDTNIENEKSATQLKTVPPLIKIDKKWIKLDAWSVHHPGGVEPLKRFYGQDATDPFYAIHSEEALKKVNAFPSATPVSGCQDAPKDTVVENFRKLRAQLKDDGWFKRNLLMDTLVVGHVIALGALATYLAPTYPVIACIVLALCMTQAGWAGHDYAHGRGSVSFYTGTTVGAFFNGFSCGWWSRKHNTHHVHTNQFGIDDDISNEPVLFLKAPEPEQDNSIRQYQHYYYHIAYAFLFFSWRMQSFQFEWAKRNYPVLAVMSLGYIWLLSFGLKIALGSLLIAGWIVAEVVTASHQSEEMLHEISHEFIRTQFNTTRDVVISNPFMSWIWGGMQHQLIHHLFPTLPRYRYGMMVPIMEKFAKENNIEYRRATSLEILKMNYQTMKTNALIFASKRKMH